MDDASLDAVLRELAPDVEFPPTPQVWPAVAARLASPRRVGWWPRGWRLALAGGVVATLLLAATVAAIALGLPGLRIILVPDGAPTAVASPGAGLGLGIPTTLDAAVRDFDGELLVPADDGPPDEVYLASDGSVVSLVYHADDELPGLADSDVGLVVMEVTGTLDGDHIEKLVPEIGAQVTRVEVSGAPGYWIEGDPHVMRYRDPSGATGEVVSRLVGDVLVWQRREVLYRIETALGYEPTLHIAESMAAPR